MEIALDITDLKRAEKSLKKYRDQLEEMVESRTLALSETNTRLRKEMAERIHAERELKQRERELEEKTNYPGGNQHRLAGLVGTAGKRQT